MPLWLSMSRTVIMTSPWVLYHRCTLKSSLKACLDLYNHVQMLLCRQLS